MFSIPRKTLSKLAAALAVLTTLAVPAAAQQLAGPNVKDGALVIPKEGISGQASFFAFTLDGTRMEVLAVRASDGSVRTALNTCQVCFNSGRGWYVQDGEVLVCQNCGNRFKIDQIERQKDGCNPIPITADLKTENAKTITIASSLLVQAKPFFARWKKTAKLGG